MKSEVLVGSSGVSVSVSSCAVGNSSMYHLFGLGIGRSKNCLVGDHFASLIFSLNSYICLWDFMIHATLMVCMRSVYPRLRFLNIWSSTLSYFLKSCVQITIGVTCSFIQSVGFGAFYTPWLCLMFVT